VLAVLQILSRNSSLQWQQMLKDFLKPETGGSFMSVRHALAVAKLQRSEKQTITTSNVS